MHAKKSLSEKINNEKITGLLCVSPFIFGFFLFLLVQQAVQAFQKHTGLPVTGVVNPATWNHMLAIFQSTLDAQAFPQYQHFPE